MEQKEAIALLRHKDFDINSRKTWIDAGCGEGVFTLALASLMNGSGTIHAIDINQKSLNKIPERYDNVLLQKWKADFVTQALPVTHADGILMANSLHYVQDKNAWISKAGSLLGDKGCFLIVEYDTDSSNPWIPYPVSFGSLQYIFNENGFSNVRRLHTRSSIYNGAGLYTALVEKN